MAGLAGAGRRPGLTRRNCWRIWPPPYPIMPGASPCWRICPPRRAEQGFLGVLNAGDVLAVDGLLAPLLAAEPGDALLYGDDRRADPIAPGSQAAYLKPAWSPDLLLSQNYIGRAWLATRDLTERAGLDPRRSGRNRRLCQCAAADHGRRRGDPPCAGPDAGGHGPERKPHGRAAGASGPSARHG